MSVLLCRCCAEWAFARWRGWCSIGTERWKQKPDLPDVPHCDASNPCDRCGGTSFLLLDDVYYHSPHSTGLPDYFVLETLTSDPFNMRRWGRPYLDPWIIGRIPLDALEDHMRSSKYSP